MSSVSSHSQVPAYTHGAVPASTTWQNAKPSEELKKLNPTELANYVRNTILGTGSGIPSQAQGKVSSTQLQPNTEASSKQLPEVNQESMVTQAKETASGNRVRQNNKSELKGRLNELNDALRKEEASLENNKKLLDFFFKEFDTEEANRNEDAKEKANRDRRYELNQHNIVKYADKIKVGEKKVEELKAEIEKINLKLGNDEKTPWTRPSANASNDGVIMMEEGQKYGEYLELMNQSKEKTQELQSARMNGSEAAVLQNLEQAQRSISIQAEEMKTELGSKGSLFKIFEGAAEFKRNIEVAKSNVDKVISALEKEPEIAEIFKAEIALLKEIASKGEEILKELDSLISNTKVDVKGIANLMGGDKYMQFMKKVGDFSAQQPDFEHKLSSPENGKTPHQIIQQKTGVNVKREIIKLVQFSATNVMLLSGLAKASPENAQIHFQRAAFLAKKFVADAEKNAESQATRGPPKELESQKLERAIIYSHPAFALLIDPKIDKNDLGWDVTPQNIGNYIKELAKLAKMEPPRAITPDDIEALKKNIRQFIKQLKKEDSRELELGNNRVHMLCIALEKSDQFKSELTKELQAIDQLYIDAARSKKRSFFSFLK